MIESYKIAKRYKDNGELEKSKEYFFRGIKNTELLMQNSEKETEELLEFIDVYMKYIELGKELIEKHEVVQMCQKVLECYNLIIEEFESKKNCLIVPLEWQENRLKIQKMIADMEENSETYIQLMQMYRVVGIDYDYRGESKKAERCYEARLSMLEKCVIDTDKEALKELSYAYFEFGLFYDYNGYFQEALEKYECSRKIDEDLFERDKTIQDGEDLITTYENIAQIYKKEGYFGKALELYQIGLEIIEKIQENDTTGKKEKFMSKCHSGIAEIYKLQGFDRKADVFLTKSKEVVEISRQENQIVVETFEEKEMPKLVQISEERDKKEPSLKKTLANLWKKVNKR